MNLSTQYLDQNHEVYGGEQLRPHYLLSQWGVKGSALAAWVGPCHVKTDHLVDWEDRLVSDSIQAAQMIHFIGEFFGMSLREGVLLQRLMMTIAGEVIGKALRVEDRFSLRREGDDLFVGAKVGSRGSDPQSERKLSVSIVTASPVSVLLHSGINVDPTGAPVAAVGLHELGLDPKVIANRILDGVRCEWESIEWACTKVRPVM